MVNFIDIDTSCAYYFYRRSPTTVDPNPMSGGKNNPPDAGLAQSPSLLRESKVLTRPGLLLSVGLSSIVTAALYSLLYCCAVIIYDVCSLNSS